MATRRVFHALEGPIQGEIVDLQPGLHLIVGRSKRGLHLPDPQVSLEHAEITYAGGRFSISDLSSVSGTYVNDKRLGREARELHEGDLVRIGESVFRIEEVRSSRLWMVPVGGVALGAFVFAGWAAVQLAAPVTFDPTLSAPKDVRGADGPIGRSVPVPISFVRQEGLDDHRVSIERVTDFDNDGVDELWLAVPDGRIVTTFVPDGWRVIGRVPDGCVDRPGGDFPDLRCADGDVWMHRDGQYSLAYTDGMVAWLDWAPRVKKGETAPPPPPGPTPFRVGLADPDALSGFLATRGVEEPIHYLICEEAVPGIAAQVLTLSGRIEALDYGCIRESRMVGTGDITGFSPVMVALTATGNAALERDVNDYLTGSSDGLFRGGRHEALLQHLFAPPAQRLTHRVSFIGTQYPGNPVAPEAPVEGRRRLLAAVPGTRAEVAETVVITERVTRIDPPGCSDLEVTVHEWYCVLNKLCMPSSTALEVKDLGCGAPRSVAKVPYTGGVVSGSTAELDIRAAVDAQGGSGRVDVLRARVAWRPAAKAIDRADPPGLPKSP